MATKTLLFDLKDAHKAVNAASKAADFKLQKGDLQVFGPDDRRFDKAVSDDTDLAKDLEEACNRAQRTFVQDAAAALADAQAEFEAPTGVPANLDRLFSTTFKKLDDAFAAFEKASGAGCAKVWKDFVSDHDELRGVKFKVVAKQWLPRFDTPKKEEEPSGRPDGPASKDELGLFLREIGISAKLEDDRLRAVVADLRKAQDDVDPLNALVDSIQEEYDSEPRESQADDESTDPDDEPDEDQLDAAIFARFAPDISSTLTTNMVDRAKIGDAAQIAAAAAKQLTELMKRLAKARTALDLDADETAQVVTLSDACKDGVRKLVVAGSKAVALKKPYDECFGVLDALKEEKAAALGRLSAARLDVTLPVEEFEEARTAIKPVVDLA